ncbi:MAG TPA: hypothetical protein VFD63_26530 [Pyrinomonadaceae bacterium]|nr:hypothetical protein [Pyrinomonadaceae bacterium]
MAKLSPEEKEAIVKKYLPGYKIVSQAEQDTTAIADREVDAGTPDFEALKEKYFGSSGEGADAVAADAGSEDDDEIVQVEPESRADPLDRGSRAKSIVISGNEIKGSQG